VHLAGTARNEREFDHKPAVPLQPVLRQGAKRGNSGSILRKRMLKK